MAGSLTINEDDRRVLKSFPEGKLLQIKQDCIVGKHYHKIKTEYFVLVEGAAELRTGLKSEIMEIGKLIKVPPLIYHEFHIKKGSVLLGLCSHPYDKTDDYYI